MGDIKAELLRLAAAGYLVGEEMATPNLPHGFPVCKARPNGVAAGGNVWLAETLAPPAGARPVCQPPDLAARLMPDQDGPRYYATDGPLVWLRAEGGRWVVYSGEDHFPLPFVVRTELILPSLSAAVDAIIARSGDGELWLAEAEHDAAPPLATK